MLGLCIGKKLKIFKSDQRLLNQTGEGIEHKNPYSFFAFSTSMKRQEKEREPNYSSICILAGSKPELIVKFERLECFSPKVISSSNRT